MLTAAPVKTYSPFSSRWEPYSSTELPAAKITGGQGQPNLVFAKLRNSRAIGEMLVRGCSASEKLKRRKNRKLHKSSRVESASHL